MRKGKGNKKVRKLLVIACMFAMILSNFSLAASTFAEELTNDQASVDPAKTETSQSGADNSSQQEESHGEPVDQNQSGNGQSEQVDPDQQGSDQGESVETGSQDNKQNPESQPIEQTAETSAVNDAPGRSGPQQENQTEQPAENLINNAIQEEIDFNQVPQLLITELSPQF